MRGCRRRGCRSSRTSRARWIRPAEATDPALLGPPPARHRPLRRRARRAAGRSPTASCWRSGRGARCARWRGSTPTARATAWCSRRCPRRAAVKTLPTTPSCSPPPAACGWRERTPTGPPSTRGSAGCASRCPPTRSSAAGTGWSAARSGTAPPPRPWHRSRSLRQWRRRPASTTARSWRTPTSRRARRTRAPSPAPGRRCSASTRSACTTTSSSSAGTRCWPPSSRRACARPCGWTCRCATCFEHPTVAALAEIVAERRGSGEDAAAAVLPTVLMPGAGDAAEPFPLTEVQQAYWIGRNGAFELGNVATHFYMEIEATGLDLDRLPARLAAGHRPPRHAARRSCCRTAGSGSCPRCRPTRSRSCDLRGSARSGGRGEAALLAVRERMSHQVLPSDRWPLFEVRATRLDGGRTRLHVSFDLLIGDAWSLAASCCASWAASTGIPTRSLPPLELSLPRLRAGRGAAPADPGLPARPGVLARAPRRPCRRPPSCRSPGVPASSTARASSAATASWSGRLGAPQGARRAGRPDPLGRRCWPPSPRSWRPGARSPRFTLNLTLFNRLPLHPQVNALVGDFTSLILLEVGHLRRRRLRGRARSASRRSSGRTSTTATSAASACCASWPAPRAARRRGDPDRLHQPARPRRLRGPGLLLEPGARASRGGRVYSISQTPQVCSTTRWPRTTAP